MKAAVIHEFGGTDVFSVEDVPRPVPARYEVLVKVHAVGINPVDWKTRQAGGILKVNAVPLPHILGWDISGVGHFAVQLAKYCGAHVIGTASARNGDFLREIGVDEVIDYNAVKFEDVLHDLDLVFETVGAATAEHALKTLKPGGMLVSCAGLPSREVIKQYDVRRVEGFLVHPYGLQRGLLARLIDAGTVKPHVDAVFSLAEVGKAHALGEQGHTRGKIVLEVP